MKPDVGVGVIVLKDKKVLVGKRKGIFEACTWQFPGVHLEFMESIEDCARREVFEEAGIKIKNPKVVAITNNFFENKEHVVVLFVLAEHDFGEPKNLEPDKCEGWQWCEWDKLPQPLFLPVENLLKQGYNPFSA